MKSATGIAPELVKTTARAVDDFEIPWRAEITLNQTGADYDAERCPEGAAGVLGHAGGVVVAPEMEETARCPGTSTLKLPCTTQEFQ